MLILPLHLREFDKTYGVAVCERADSSNCEMVICHFTPPQVTVTQKEGTPEPSGEPIGTLGTVLGLCLGWPKRCQSMTPAWSLELTHT